MTVLSFTVPWPISANRYWATTCYFDKRARKWRPNTYVTPEAVSYKTEVAWLAKAAGARVLTQRLSLRIELYPARPQDAEKRAAKDPMNWDDTVRSLDVDNCQKVLIDALKGIVYDDDDRLWDIHTTRMEPTGKARAVIRIEPIVRVSPQLSFQEPEHA